MARPSRCDEPGSWHHVINRAIARRTLFETRADMRFFLAQVAEVVRRGLIEVHAYCMMATHFHMLVRSLVGDLAAAMRLIELLYVRHFNRTRGRDGPLVRGRFLSRPVDSDHYRLMVVRYIDQNPVLARLVPKAIAYPYGSARWYASARSPRWLARDWVEGQICTLVGGDAYDPSDYDRVFGSPLSPAQQRLIERRLEHARGPDPLGDLVAAAPERVREWMRCKAALADGTEPGLPIADPTTVIEVLAREVTGLGRLIDRTSEDLVVLVALLRDLCGAPWTEIGRRVSRTGKSAHEIYNRHRAQMERSSGYADRVAHVSATVLERLR